MCVCVCLYCRSVNLHLSLDKREEFSNCLAVVLCGEGIGKEKQDEPSLPLTFACSPPSVLQHNHQKH